MEKKCVICGKPAVYESMTMASPVCEKCAKKMIKLLGKEPTEDNIEEVYVPFAGDVTSIRENQ